MIVILFCILASQIRADMDIMTLAGVVSHVYREMFEKRRNVTDYPRYSIPPYSRALKPFGLRLAEFRAGVSFSR
jgi:hypothetical protein